MSKKVLAAWGNAGCVWRTREEALNLEDPRKNNVGVWWKQGGRSVGWDPKGGGLHGSGRAPGAREALRRRRSPASGGSRAEQWRPPRGTQELAREARAGRAGIPGARAPEEISLLFLWPSGRRERACGSSRPSRHREGGRNPGAARERLGRRAPALPGLQAPRSAASEDGPALPAAAAPHALPRCEPRRSRGWAAAAGRLVPGSAWGPESTPDGHPRAPRRFASALRALTGPHTGAKPVLLG